MQLNAQSSVPIGVLFLGSHASTLPSLLPNITKLCTGFISILFISEQLLINGLKTGLFLSLNDKFLVMLLQGIGHTTGNDTSYLRHILVFSIYSNDQLLNEIQHTDHIAVKQTIKKILID